MIKEGINPLPFLGFYMKEILLRVFKTMGMLLLVDLLTSFKQLICKLVCHCDDKNTDATDIVKKDLEKDLEDEVKNG